MFFKKKLLLLTLSLIIILQTLLYLNNNNNKTTFRYFKWSVQEVSIGKLISISFFSGLLISSLLATTNTRNSKNTIESKENDESFEFEENIKSNMEIPPQRDIRETQPTISVNYRVVKNTEENNFKRDKNYSNTFDKEDDWDDGDNDW